MDPRGGRALCCLWATLLLAPPRAAALKEHFLFQGKAECRFSNGTQRVRFLERHFFDRQELAYFDSDIGKFVAVAELGETQVESWNKDKDFLRNQKTMVDAFCRDNYGAVKPISQSRRGMSNRWIVIYW